MTALVLLSVIIIIVLIHWFADFVLQTRWQANNKSKLLKALLYHTGIYSAIWLFPMLIIFNGITNDFYLSLKLSLYFTIITFVCHTTTDYITSRVNARFWINLEFDQVLHSIQLFVTFYCLCK